MDEIAARVGRRVGLVLTLVLALLGGVSGSEAQPPRSGQAPAAPLAAAAAAYEVGDYHTALRCYTAIYRAKGGQAPAAMYWAGQCLAALHRYQASADLHQALAVRHPRSPWVLPALYRSACVTGGWLGRHDKAIALYATVMKLSPQSTWARDALFCVAAIHLHQGRVAQARVELDRLVELFPDNPRAVAARALLRRLGR